MRDPSIQIKTSGVTFDRLKPADLFAIERQASQSRVLGAEPEDIGLDTAELLASQPVAWAARHEGRLVALFGIGEHYPGTHGVAWSILGRLGPAHLPVTRRVRAELLGSGLARVELIARAADTPYRLRDAWGTGGRADLRWALGPRRITPECRWALLLGFTAAHVLHRYGPDGETHMLFEWFGPASGEAGCG